MTNYRPGATGLTVTVADISGLADAIRPGQTQYAGWLFGSLRSAHHDHLVTCLTR